MSEPSQPAARFDLRALTPGVRLLAWLGSRSNDIWIDSVFGRMLARAARACGGRSRAAWQGPLARNRPSGAPVLSWFSEPLAIASPEAFAISLNESLRSATQDMDAETRHAGAQSMQRIRELRALDASYGPAHCPRALAAPRHTPQILLIDERARYTGSGLSRRERIAAFRAMAATAGAAHPGATFWLAKAAQSGHGDWLSTLAPRALPSDIRIFDSGSSVCAAIERVDHVYVVDATDGLHALLTGVPLHVFGAPFFAGWGLTDDARSLPGRNARPPLEIFFAEIFLRRMRYLDPTTHAPGKLDALLDCIALQRSTAQRYAATPEIAGIRFQWWKRHYATPFLGAGFGRLRWISDPSSLAPNECAALWGTRSRDGLPAGGRHLRIEDGFLHSHGLGSDMSPPRSQVIDRRGIYFDASCPSDLTAILNETEFTQSELNRAAALREQIVQYGLTKYNLGRRRPQWNAPHGRRVVLVTGQVADDASIRLGTRAINTASELLRAARERRPDAWIVYKPHPDVLSGNRKGLIDGAAQADVVDTESDLISLIEVADEVHTLSSLSGFEALLHGKSVFTYGMPFYAGWGLTEDAIASIPWRHRSLTLDMLTAGVLLRYPVYWDWGLQLFTTPERIVAELAPLAARRLASIDAERLRTTRKVFRWTLNALRHLRWRYAQRREKPNAVGSVDIADADAGQASFEI